MEIFDTASPESTPNDHAKSAAIGKNAVRFFGAGASIVIAIALYYCWSTGHKAEFVAVGIGYLALVGIAVKIYRSL